MKKIPLMGSALSAGGLAVNAAAQSDQSMDGINMGGGQMDGMKMGGGTSSTTTTTTTTFRSARHHTTTHKRRTTRHHRRAAAPDGTATSGGMNMDQGSMKRMAR